jgi:Holliday junction resolvase RusA-like endonuclease
VTFTIEGAPRTKKNSLRRIRRGRRTFTVSSAAHEAWANSAVLQLRAQVRRAPSDLPVAMLPYFTSAVNMRALVYRDRDVGDLLNFLAAISDALEAAGVVADDKLVLGLDGSRLLLDRKRPRVEVELTVFVSSEEVRDVTDFVPVGFVGRLR